MFAPDTDGQNPMNVFHYVEDGDVRERSLLPLFLRGFWGDLLTLGNYLSK